jgi:hypothetical protein
MATLKNLREHYLGHHVRTRDPGSLFSTRY